ncbi:MAG: hypothetical protein NTW78_03970 [Campylobacterales bacterium]|nr:hypothetical protein [Campylobacterales bacterium]
MGKEYILKVVFAVGMLFVFLLAYLYYTKEEYKYNFDKRGIPTSRMKLKNGSVEVYSNLHSKKFTDNMLRNIYKEGYTDMDYNVFLDKVKKRYINLEFKYEDDFIWLDLNDFIRIKELKEFDTKY